MSRDAPRSGSPVLAVLEDPAAAADALELTVSLARVLEREVGIVHVHSSSALRAAALPAARVLAHAGSGWQPLSSADVERGFRAQGDRLREIATRIAVRQEVRWSMRSVLGEAVPTALDSAAETDLVLLAGRILSSSVAGGVRGRRPRRRIVVTVAGDTDGYPLEIAGRLAGELAGVLERAVLPPHAADASALVVRSTDSDLLVLPRGLLTAQAIALLRGPVLLVG